MIFSDFCDLYSLNSIHAQICLWAYGNVLFWFQTITIPSVVFYNDCGLHVDDRFYSLAFGGSG
jgi:hypothetical protein